MKLFAPTVFIVTLLQFCYAQNSVKAFVYDGTDKKPLQGVTAIIEGTNKSTVSDSTGAITFINIPLGKVSIQISYVGFEPQVITISVPQLSRTLPKIYLQRIETKNEEVIVTSSRTNSRIEDLPTKVEVVGSEEVDEENGIRSSGISGILGDVAGIQIQQNSAVTANADARIQGLPGKYTQILRDGMPLFGGYSGSFNVLQIPPSDLKQIEIIKGSSSTLYGGGAIAGLINLVTKSPRLNNPEREITLNETTLKETNANVYLSSRNKIFGYTFFSGLTHQSSVDVNKDGYSDAPHQESFFLHPKFFFYPNSKQVFTLGYNLSLENRKGGDMEVLKEKIDSTHQFYIRNKSARNIVDASWQYHLRQNEELNVKAAINFFDRDIKTNLFGMRADQSSWFSEASYLKKMKAHDIVGGINFSGESLFKERPDSTKINPYRYTTIGIFIQDDWKLTNKWVVQSGLRLDRHNAFGNFILPRISVLYKITNNILTRLGAGLGYRVPTPVSIEIDERDYPKVQPFTSSTVSAERSEGINWDINYKKYVNGWKLTVNQMLYYTRINKPVVETTSINGDINYYNASKPLTTAGFETYISLIQEELELYAGYTYTVAKQLYDASHPYVSLSARDKFATVVAYELLDKVRVGYELSYTGKQWLDNGNTTPGYVITAAMVRYNVKNVSLVLNCENLLDYRQTRKENIVYGSSISPYFKQIWAPIDGRVLNLSAKFSW